MPIATEPDTNSAGNGSRANSTARLVLCFDGTGQQYKGDTSDTNIVKLYQKFERGDPKQFHYYQPGIGTYSSSEKSVNLSPWGKLKHWFNDTMDDAFGTSFDQHVMEGYRFVMRYYDEGDKIYMFGYSRGAFTARFLARMISTIGVLSKGNEEMVRFAYKSYQDYETASGPFKTSKEHQVYMDKFKKTFCRKDTKVFFLGLFDTVSSVGIFDNVFRRPSYLPTVVHTAEHVRHAVSIDERRSRFKPALLDQDVVQTQNSDEDIKEVFFAGNHGDVGGGWAASGDNIMTDETDDPVQLSDIPLAWMITAVQDIEKNDPVNGLAFNDNAKVFLDNFGGKVKQAELATKHDTLSFNGSPKWVLVVLWNLTEWLPIERIELINNKWTPVYFPPNMGGTRDIPPGATIHPSVLQRMKAMDDYRPSNDGLEYLCQEADAAKRGTTNGV